MAPGVCSPGVQGLIWGGDGLRGGWIDGGALDGQTHVQLFKEVGAIGVVT